MFDDHLEAILRQCEYHLQMSEAGIISAVLQECAPSQDLKRNRQRGDQNIWTKIICNWQACSLSIDRGHLMALCTNNRLASFSRL